MVTQFLVLIFFFFEINTRERRDWDRARTMTRPNDSSEGDSLPDRIDILVRQATHIYLRETDKVYTKPSVGDLWRKEGRRAWAKCFGSSVLVRSSGSQDLCNTWVIIADPHQFFFCFFPRLGTEEANMRRNMAERSAASRPGGTQRSVSVSSGNRKITWLKQKPAKPDVVRPCCFFSLS